MFQKIVFISVLFSLMYFPSSIQADRSDSDTSEFSEIPPQTTAAEMYITGIVVDFFNHSLREVSSGVFLADGPIGIIVQTEAERAFVDTLEMVGCPNPNVDYPIIQIGDSVEAFGLRGGEHLRVCPSSNYYLRKIDASAPQIDSNQSLDMLAMINAQVGLNFRECPNEACIKIGRLDYQTSWSIVGRTADNAWILLDVNGTQGWVSANWLILYNDFQDITIIDTSDTRYGKRNRV